MSTQRDFLEEQDPPIRMEQLGRTMNGHRLVRANYHPQYGILESIEGTTATLIPFRGNHNVWPTIRERIQIDTRELATRQPSDWFRTMDEIREERRRSCAICGHLQPKHACIACKGIS